MSNEGNIIVISEDISVRMKRDSTNESSLSVRTSIAVSLLLTFSAITLGLFVHDRFQKFMRLPEESFYPELSVLPVPRNINNSQTKFPLSSDSRPSIVSNNPRTESEDWVGPKELWHSMSDEELFWRASMVSNSSVIECPNYYCNNRTQKLAFMFLAKGKLPFAPIWEMFFKGHEGLYSIYIHTSPEHAYEPPESSVFYKRRIPSQGVQWGKKTMVDAERRLLGNALLDNSNERFILLSETCIPIFNFTTIYNYLINSNQSFLGLFDDPRYMGRGRYNKKMWPVVSLSDWRKGSQWFEAHRSLAIKIVSESRYYPVFVEHCKPPCYMDEHYFPTMVNIVCPNLTSNRSITWVDWSRGGPHPATFVRRDISQNLFNHIRHDFNCTYNGHITNMCFLFARKFHPSALEPLLRLSPYLIGINASS